MEIQIIVNKGEVLKKVKKFFSPNLMPPYRSQYGSVNPTAIVGPMFAVIVEATFIRISLSQIQIKQYDLQQDFISLMFV